MKCPVNPVVNAGGGMVDVGWSGYEGSVLRGVRSRLFSCDDNIAFIHF